MSISESEIQRRLREYKSPTYGYRRGDDGEVEKDLFDAVLPKGWFDSPAAVDGPQEPARKPAPISDRTPPKAPPIVSPGTQTEVVPPYDRFNFPTLRDELVRRTGKGTRPGTDKDTLIGMLAKLDGTA